MNGNKIKCQKDSLLFYALLAKAAQCQKHEKAVKQLNGFMWFDYAKLHTVTKAEFLLVVQEKVLYVVFRGTEFELSDILANINAQKKKKNHIEVHKGYCDKLCYSGAFQEVDIITEEFSITEIIIVGHSMGGALAQLMAYFLMQKQYYDRIECVTFGSARPFAKQVLPMTTEIEIKNYQIKKDYVRYFPFGFTNCGESYFISSEGDITSDRGQKGYKIFPSALWSLFVNKRHNIDEYIKRLSLSLLEGGYER